MATSASPEEVFSKLCESLLKDLEAPVKIVEHKFAKGRYYETIMPVKSISIDLKNEVFKVTQTGALPEEYGSLIFERTGITTYVVRKRESA